jgi:hypothetical protein
MAPYIIILLVAAYAASVFIRNTAARFLALFAVDAAVIGIMAVCTVDAKSAVFFGAAAFALNVFMCLPDEGAPAFTFGKNEFLLAVLGFCLVSVSAFFAARFGIRAQEAGAAFYTASAAGALFSVCVTAGYFILNHGNKEGGDE